MLSARPAGACRPPPDRQKELTITTIAHPQRPRVTVGVDTHLDVHVAVAHANDQLGRRMATVSIPTTPAGYQDLLAWARGLGEVQAWGVEGTGCYGAALTRFLGDYGQDAVAATLNSRPRKTLGWRTPAEALNEQLLLIQQGGVATTP